MWTRVLRTVLFACALVLLAPAVATADPGQGPGQNPAQGPGPNPGQGSAAGSQPGLVEPEKPEPMIGAPGTHAAHESYGYSWPEAPDCDESIVSSAGCINDGLGFFQGQCTSWVAHRLNQRNGLAFSNWYAGRHWGDATDWAAVAREMGRKPDKIPAVGAIAWFRRGHVAYVEEVNTDGSIVLSEMNFDGHNGFRLVTVTPGLGWPDRFLHLSDVAPSDVTPPTTPSGLTAERHAGGVRLQWQPASDNIGVQAYRVSRDDIELVSGLRSTAYADERASAGQNYTYSVTAVDAAGNVSAPATLRVDGSSSDVGETWVTTGAGPALCGRAGTATRPSLGCRVRTREGWRYAGLDGSVPWGQAGTRAFVPSDDGLAYCRRVGPDLASTRAACVQLDTETLEWGKDRVSGAIDLPLVVDSSWVRTTEGPALCGRSGTPRLQRVGCAILTSNRWRSVTSDRVVRWGHVGSRALVANEYGAVSFCRTVGPNPARPGLACAPFVADSLSWGYDRISDDLPPALPTNRAWVATDAGEALCGRAGTLVRQRVACSVLTQGGWRHASTSARWGRPLTRAVVTTGDQVSWCRLVGTDAVRASCTALTTESDTEEPHWRHGRLSGELGESLASTGTWTGSGSEPTFCGRTGTTRHHRVGCLTLADRRWHLAGVDRDLAWGEVGARAFVPGTRGFSYCRSLAQRGSADREVCTTV